MRLIGKSVEERLAAYTKRKGKCLVWTGAVNDKDKTKGYGVIQILGRTKFVHQVAYELAHGKIPRGKVVRHTCDNRLCCEPTHLILGSHKENTQDMVDRGRSAKGSKHGRAKLTEKDVLAIREANSKGTKQAELARNYSVAETTIEAILKRKTWKHI